jgi:metal-sulfur cluster biosynthetic enzyme
VSDTISARSRPDVEKRLLGANFSCQVSLQPVSPRDMARYPSGMSETVTRDDVVEALRQVEDPELGMDIVDLGLMYDVTVEGPKVHVLFTLTSMGCPVGPMIEQQINDVTAALPGVEQVETELTWDPPWSPEKMSDDAKFILGFG